MSSASSRRGMSIIKRVYPEYTKIDWRKVQIPAMVDFTGNSVRWVMPASGERWKVQASEPDPVAYPQYDFAPRSVQMRLHLSHANKMFSSAFKVLIKYSNFVLGPDLVPIVVDNAYPIKLPVHYLHAYTNDVEDIRNYASKMVEVGYEPMAYAMCTAVRQDNLAAPLPEQAVVLSPFHAELRPDADEARDPDLSAYPLAGGKPSDVRLLRRMSIFGCATDEKAVIKRCIGQLHSAYDHLGSAVHLYRLLKEDAEIEVAGQAQHETQSDSQSRRFEEARLLLTKREETFLSTVMAYSATIDIPFLNVMTAYPDLYNPLAMASTNARLPCPHANMHSRLRAFAMSIMLGYLNNPEDSACDEEHEERFAMEQTRKWIDMAGSANPNDVFAHIFNYRLTTPNSSIEHRMRTKHLVDPEFKQIYDVIVGNIAGTTASAKIFHWAGVDMANLLAYYLTNFHDACMSTFKLFLSLDKTATGEQMLRARVKEMLATELNHPIRDTEAETIIRNEEIPAAMASAPRALYPALFAFYNSQHQKDLVEILLTPLNSLYMDTMRSLIVETDEVRIRDPVLRKKIDKAQPAAKKQYAKEAKNARKERRTQMKRMCKKVDAKERRQLRIDANQLAHKRMSTPGEMMSLSAQQYEAAEPTAAAPARRGRRPGGAATSEEAHPLPAPRKTEGVSQPVLSAVLTEALTTSANLPRVTQMQQLNDILFGPSPTPIVQALGM